MPRDVALRVPRAACMQRSPRAPRRGCSQSRLRQGVEAGLRRAMRNAARMSRRAELLSVFVVQRHFRQVRRGYDRDEVDQHLERVRTWFAETGMQQTAREIEGHFDERERVLQAVEEDGRRRLPEAREQAAHAQREAPPRRAATEQETAELLAAAQGDAAAVLGAARSEAEELRAAAQADA